MVTALKRLRVKPWMGWNRAADMLRATPTVADPSSGRFAVGGIHQRFIADVSTIFSQPRLLTS
jgi:hypothetical protein